MNPLLLLFLVACQPPTGTDDTADTADTGLDDGLSRVVVTTTDFAVGSLATVDLDSFDVTDEITTTSSDPLVYAEDGHVFQVNGFGHDSVSVYAPGEYAAPEAQFSAGGGTNPYDVALIDGELFVSLYEEAHLGVFDPDSGTSLGTVDLSAHADADGIPEAASMVEVDGLLYVALQRLDRDNGWVDAGGKVVQVDPSTKQITEDWDVGPNPTVHAHPSDPGKLIVRAGLYATADGGIRVLDPAQDAPEDWLLEGSELGWGVSAYAEIDSGDAVVIAEHTDMSTYEVKCMASDGTLADGWSGSDWIPAVTVDDRGRGWVVVRSATGTSGLRVIDLATCTEVTTDPIETSLAPYRIAVY